MKFLENIDKLPNEKKKRFAIFSALIITFVILIIWLSLTFSSKNFNLDIKNDNSLDTVANDISKIGGTINELKSAIGKQSDEFKKRFSGSSTESN